MAFTPRTFSQIRDDMLAYIRMQTRLTDEEIGSVNRSVIEAAALEDDEQYFQMVQLLDAFRLSSATGKDLRDRVAEYGIVPLQAGPASGSVQILNNLLIRSELALNETAGSLSVRLDDSSGFPTSGFPYTARIGEGTIGVEDVTVIANVLASDALTLSTPTVNNHNIGDRVSFVSGAADIAIAAAVKVQVPATGTSAPVVFSTLESGVVVDGNYESTPISIRADVPGVAGNVGAQRIVEFTSAPPFSGAGVTNLSRTGGGRGVETDADLKDRARSQIQSLSKATVLALKSGVKGVVDPVTGQRVTTSNLREDIVNDEVIVYVDDGTGFTPDQIVLARTATDGAVGVAAGSFVVLDVDDLPDEGFVLVSPEDPAQIELLEFSSVTRGTKTINLVGTTANAHDNGDEVVLIDYVEDSAEPGTNFFQLANFPVVSNTIRIWVSTGGAFIPQVKDVDYKINKGTGQLEFIGAGVAAGAKIIATYSHYTGLIKTAQTVIDGSVTDPTNYPGLRAAGIIVRVETPTIRRITVRLSITVASGREESDIIPSVQEAVSAYINGLGIGEDVIVAEIIERAMSVDGMFNVVVTLPTSDVIVLEEELPVPFDSSGNSLVTVN